MKIKLVETGPSGEDGEHYHYEIALDIASTEEAYVKGREYMRLRMALHDGIEDELLERGGERTITIGEDDEDYLEEEDE